MATQVLNTPVVPAQIAQPSFDQRAAAQRKQTLLEAEIREKFEAQRIKGQLEAAERSNFLGGLTSTMQLALKAHSQGNMHMASYLFSGLKKSVRANWKKALQAHPFIAKAIVQAETAKDFFGAVPPEIAQEFEFKQVELGVKQQQEKALKLEVEQKQQEAEYRETGKMSRAMGIQYLTNAVQKIQQAEQIDPKTFEPKGKPTGGGNKADSLTRMFAEVLRTSGQPELATMLLKNRGIEVDAKGRPVEPKPVLKVKPGDITDLDRPAKPVSPLGKELGALLPATSDMLSEMRDSTQRSLDKMLKRLARKPKPNAQGYIPIDQRKAFGGARMFNPRLSSPTEAPQPTTPLHKQKRSGVEPSREQRIKHLMQRKPTSVGTDKTEEQLKEFVAAQRGKVKATKKRGSITASADQPFKVNEWRDITKRVNAMSALERENQIHKLQAELKRVMKTVPLEQMRSYLWADEAANTWRETKHQSAQKRNEASKKLLRHLMGLIRSSRVRGD